MLSTDYTLRDIALHRPTPEDHGISNWFGLMTAAYTRAWYALGHNEHDPFRKADELTIRTFALILSHVSGDLYG